jgi:hypothetical protein
LLLVLLTSQAAAQSSNDEWLQTDDGNPLWLTDQDEVVPVEPYLDLNRFLDRTSAPDYTADAADWAWQILPDGLIYRPYLASPKQSRTGMTVFHEDDDGWLWDAWLGTQVGLLRYGTFDPDWPIGFQIDAEGSAQLRLEANDDIDVISADYRAGVPITFGYGRHRTKFAYYHLSSHLGDEFLLQHPGFNRLNFARDVLVLGHSIYLTPKVRIYAEAGWAFFTDVSKEWEFQFGLDYAPYAPTSIRGAPFFAINGSIREELNYSGNFVLQAGWAWRGETSHLLRTGFHYYNGLSDQYSFYRNFEHQVGGGLWYDF